MSVFPGKPRSTAILCAALLAGVSTLGPARAEPVGSDATRTEASTQAADPVPEGGTSDVEGPPPESDFKDVPAPDDTVAAPAPDALQPPTDPVGAALFARLAEEKPLLPRLPAKQRPALQAFYAGVGFKTVWIVDGEFTPAARALIARLRAAGEDGLDPAAYPIPEPATKPASVAKADPNTTDPAKTAELGNDAGKPEIDADALARAQANARADLQLSAGALLYARDARGGRLNLAALSRLVTPTLDLPSADVLLPKLVGAGDEAGTTLQAYNPQTYGYRALRTRLATLRGGVQRKDGERKDGERKDGQALRLPSGPVLSVGMSDPRVPALRRHFGLPERMAGTLDAEPGTPERYDQAVADAVAAFQRGRDLPATGTLTRATLSALALEPKPPAPRNGAAEADLLVNMERWRWLPGELGADYVLVNVPEFRLRVFRGGTVRDETRVITGKPESPTPLFSGAMEYAIVNPSWYVPPSILKTMLASGKTGGFEVVRRNGQVSLRQPPGERNALGFIKFMFPNQHAVYLHDTPNRSLFSQASRALSHGCVRVDDPFRFAGTVLPPEWTAERLRKLIGHGERTIRLTQKLPVHLAYFTAYLDDAGTYRTLPDLYGYDAKMKAALGLSAGSVPVAQRPSEPARRSAEMPVVDAAPAARKRQAARPPARRQAVYDDPYRYDYGYRQRATRADAFDGWGGPPPVQSRGWW